MKVKCIDNSRGDGISKAHERLVVGQIYEVRLENTQYSFTGKFEHCNISLVGVEGSYYQSRFVLVPENACPQCGEVH